MNLVTNGCCPVGEMAMGWVSDETADLYNPTVLCIPLSLSRKQRHCSGDPTEVVVRSKSWLVHPMVQALHAWA